MKAIRIIGIITASVCVYSSWLFYYSKEPVSLLHTIWITSMAVFYIVTNIKEF